MANWRLLSFSLLEQVMVVGAPDTMWMTRWGPSTTGRLCIFAVSTSHSSLVLWVRPHRSRLSTLLRLRSHVTGCTGELTCR